MTQPTADAKTGAGPRVIAATWGLPRISTVPRTAGLRIAELQTGELLTAELLTAGLLTAGLLTAGLLMAGLRSR